LSSHFGDVVGETWGWVEVDDVTESEDDMKLEDGEELEDVVALEDGTVPEDGMVLLPPSPPSLRLGSPC